MLAALAIREGGVLLELFVSRLSLCLRLGPPSHDSFAGPFVLVTLFTEEHMLLHTPYIEGRRVKKPKCGVSLGLLLFSRFSLVFPTERISGEKGNRLLWLDPGMDGKKTRRRFFPFLVPRFEKGESSSQISALSC
ncbi:hypothetical protein HDV62DRAFT_175761 [Trichoderma sp. SZMC 28011]